MPTDIVGGKWMFKKDIKKLLDILKGLCIVDDKHTGSVVLHLAEGSLVSYDVNKKGRFKDLEVSR